MENMYISFLLRHWMLVAAFGLTVLTIMMYEWVGKRFGPKKITPQEAIQLINRKGGVVMDIRSPELFHSGHIVQSIRLNPEALDAPLDQHIPVHSTPIILIGETEMGTWIAAQKIRQKGFTHVQILTNGIRGWKAADLPLVRD